MDKLFRLAVIFIILLSLSISALPVMAVDEPDEVTLHRMAGYRNLISDNDIIFIVPYLIDYPLTPSETIEDTYIFEIYDTEVTTLIGSSTAYPYNDNGYGNGLISFYFDSTGNITYGEAYIFRVTQNPIQFDSPDYWSFTMSSYDYEASSETEDNRDALYSELVNIATDLSIKWGIELLDEEGGDSILSSYGESYFRRAIPNLQVMCPNIFSAYQEQVDFSRRSWDYSLAETLTTRYDGTFIGDFMTGFAGLIGTNTNIAFNILSIVIFAVLVCLSVWKFRGTTHSAFMDGQALLIWASLNSMFSLILCGLLAFICSVVVGFILFFNRS